MGIYDRQYYRDDDMPGGIQLGGQRMMVTNLVLLNLAIFVVDAFTPGIYAGSELVGRWLSDKLTLRPDVIQHPWRIYELITYGFSHAAFGTDTTIFHVGFNMFMLWMFGRSVEQRYGRREFLTFYLVSIVVVGIVWLVLQYAALNLRGTPMASRTAAISVSMASR